MAHIRIIRRMAGPMPAISARPMDRSPTSTQKMMMAMLGGIRLSRQPDATMQPIERLSSYLAFRSWGMAILANTMFAARDIPLTAPNTALPPTVAISMPPRTRLVHLATAV